MIERHVSYHDICPILTLQYHFHPVSLQGDKGPPGPPGPPVSLNCVVVKFYVTKSLMFDLSRPGFVHDSSVFL